MAIPSYLLKGEEQEPVSADPCSVGRHVGDHFMRASIGAMPPRTTSRELCNSCKKFAVDGKDVVTIAKDKARKRTATYPEPYGAYWIDPFRLRL